MLRRALLVAAPLALLAPAVSEASWDPLPGVQSRGERGGGRGGDRGGDRGRGGGRGGGGGGSRSVPEFDPSAVGAIAAMIGGGALFLGSRRKK